MTLGSDVFMRSVTKDAVDRKCYYHYGYYYVYAYIMPRTYGWCREEMAWRERRVGVI